MQAIEKALLHFFENVAQKEPALLTTLERETCFKIEQGRWLFTLPDLHRFIQQRNDEIKLIEYAEFRSVVFGTAINRTIGKYGAKIIIATNHGKVDQSEYALVW